MAKSLVRQVIKQIMIVLSLLAALAFFQVCLIPFVSPNHFWWIGLFGLSAPYLMVLLVLITLFWLMVKPVYALLPIVTLVIGYKQIKVFFGTNKPQTWSAEKKDSAIRIVTWNIQGFNGLTVNRNSRKLIRNEVAESIQKLEPDVICLQEFNHSFTTDAFSNNVSLFSENYPHHYFSKDYVRNDGKYAAGCIIFSKHKIIAHHKKSLPGGESIISADIVRAKDTFSVFTTHLQSFKFKKNDYDNIEKVKDNHTAYEASLNVAYKMKPAFKIRAQQADIVKQEVSKSTYPAFVCGDFNDVPNSYTYFTIAKNLQDVFLQQGLGLGRTYISLAPTLRIDYILYNPNLYQSLQFDLVDEGLSDHAMLVADFLKK